MAELKSILHVDDDPDILDIARMSLELVGGYEVSQSDNAEQALAMLDEAAPDLLLLDVMMPDTDGPKLLEAIRSIERYRSIPAIFMTAKADAEVKDRLAGKGVLGVITKPFDPMALPTRLAELWENGVAHSPA